ncbi:hypothetical protein SELMODRAFT_402179 [Selaginella moellendorffii]|uniref:Uncharacterized protein n=1 Tax=Selaginella moellendorffii TaxID=88036 RepID=D8QPU7_SELML|nr:hypothetical protein SELMODRAFT_402179 [Selaginella moellendorffii]
MDMRKIPGYLFKHYRLFKISTGATYAWKIKLKILEGFEALVGAGENATATALRSDGTPSREPNDDFLCSSSRSMARPLGSDDNDGLCRIDIHEDIDDIGAAKDLGGVVGLLSGLLYNMYPPWVTIGIGAALHFFGYTMVWMTVAGKVAPSFWLFLVSLERKLCMYSAVGNGGDNWIDTACMMTSLQNYEEQRGTAMGILKAQLGLSGAIFVMIYEVFLEPNVNQFLLLMSLVPTLAYVLLAFFVRPFDHTEDEDPSAAPRFKMAFITVLVLGIFMMVSLASKLIRFPRKFFPPSSEGIDLPKLETKASDLQDAEEERLNLLKTGTDPSQVLTYSQIATPAAASTTLKDALADFNFWLIFLVVTIGAGTGVAIINNLAQIGKSLRAGGTDIYVGLISVWSCFGRLGSGYGSDLLMRRGYPRTLCLLIDQMIMALCCLLLATGLISSLFIGSALTGLSYGAYWTLIPAILSEVFGVHNFTVLYKLVSLGPPLGSYILSAKVMGSLYDEEAALYRQKSGGASVSAGGDDLNNCYGSKCFGFGLLPPLSGNKTSLPQKPSQIEVAQFTTFEKLTDEQDCLRYTRVISGIARFCTEARDYVHNVMQGFVMKGLLPDVVAKAKKSAKCRQEEYRLLFYCVRLELAIFLKVFRVPSLGSSSDFASHIQALDEPGEKDERLNSSDILVIYRLCAHGSILDAYSSNSPLSGNDKTKQNRVTYHKKNLCFRLQGLESETMKSWDGRGCGGHKHLAEQFAQFLGDNALVERHLNFNGVAGRNLCLP